MYKALITDLDGTAVAISSDGSEIDSETIDAVTYATQQGKIITCATGREWELTKSIVKKLGITAPCIIEGGTRIIDPVTEETLWDKSLNKESEKFVMEAFKTFSSTGFIMHSLNTSRQPLATIDVLPEGLRFLYLLAIEEDSAINICNQLNTDNGTVAHYTPSWEGDGLVDVHVTHQEATKEHAIHVWQKLQSVKKEETIGMGDSGNDIPTFNASGYKIAVHNATPELKALADYIAPAVSDGALQYVIKNILIK
jgi:HAD superfamily hydrolase (TIGR01484 family)